MTINVLLETLLGKACLLDGTFGDATPFTSNSVNIAEKICDRLEKTGYNKFGWETLYNGFTGEPIDANIYCFAKGTKVLMGDGTIKNIECIVIGDYVMGADAKPKIVNFLPRGHGKMYNIKPVFNTREDSIYGSNMVEEEGYTVNEDHYLVLYTNSPKYIYKNEKRNAWVIIYPELIFDEDMGFERFTKREKSFCWTESDDETEMYETSELAEHKALEKRDELIKLGCGVNIYHRQELNIWSVWVRKQPDKNSFKNEKVLDIKTEKEISRFKSVTDAGKTLGIDPSGISKVCNGKTKSCGGFKWKYEESLEITYEKIEKTTYSFKYGEKSRLYKYKNEEEAYKNAIELYNKIDDNIEWKVTVSNYLKFKKLFTYDEELRLSWCPKVLDTFSSESNLNIQEFIESCYIDSGNKNYNERINIDMFGWLLGMWTGDGKNNLIFIDYQQTEILNRCKELAKQLNVEYKIKTYGEGDKEHYHFTFNHEDENKNTFIVMLKKLGIYDNKEFSEELTSDLLNQPVTFRQKIIEGMIDADGHLPNIEKYNQDCDYYIIGQSPRIHNSSMLMIRTICRSLGLKSTIRNVTQTSGKKLHDMWSMCISGQNLINVKPVTVYKQMPKKYFEKPFKNTLKIQFEILEKDDDDFYGITIEQGSNQNFILSDFQVVSNCGPTFYSRLKHMVSDKMHCLDFNTEVLTKNGWKTVHQLSKNDLIATLKDEKLVYEEPIDIMIYNNYEGSMYYIKNSSIDFAVTGNHRMWVSKSYGRKEEWQQYTFERADEIIGKHRKYKKDALWEKEDYEFILPGVIKFITPTLNEYLEPKKINMQDWLIFFGIWYAEGWASGTDTIGYVTISVNKQRVKDNLFKILKHFKNYTYDNAEEKINIYDYQFYRYMKPLSVGAENKKLPEWVFDLSIEQARYLMEGMLLGETNCECYYTTSIKLADQFQQLCLHAGWSGTISIAVKAGNESIINGRKVISNYDTLRISVITKKLYPSVNHSHVYEQDVQEEKYIEKEKCPVFCLQVPSEVFYVRRNGKCAWTANSRSQGHVTTLNFWELKDNLKKVFYLVILLWRNTWLRELL